ncbi:MAG: HAD hydrolase-like protein [Promicromonosporaceae bacterium]|nr:HAD hydrolase-like protein [Promicromonosporaceae bacterium]
MTSALPQAGLLASERPLAEAYDLALVDLDGVARKGHLAIPHAAESLTAAATGGLTAIYVTNNASATPEAVAEQLTGLGFIANASSVMTSAQACAQLLAKELAPGSPVLVVGAEALREAVAEQGLSVVASADERPAAVAQGFSPDLTWAHLAEAAYAVEQGARYFASNLDLSLPTARGYAPGNGALVGAVVNATGVGPVSAGKPNPEMYLLAVGRARATRPLVIGDRLDTDLGGARAAGLPGLHVFTGVSSARDAVLAEPHYRPSFLGADLRVLHEPHPLPWQADGGWWLCGPAKARVTGGRLELAGAPSGLDTVRAACMAVWAAADGGVAVDPTSIPEFEV